MYKNNQVNSFQPETEHYFEILKYSKIIFYLIEHKIKSYSPLHWSEARLNSIRSNHVLKKFRHCELRTSVIFLWCCIFHVCICDLIFLLHLLTSHRKLKGLWIFGEPLWTLDPSEKSNETAATISSTKTLLNMIFLLSELKTVLDNYVILSIILTIKTRTSLPCYD